nr:DNA-processing protein DprA [Candidatus Omnitrophota bacterium]
ETFAGDLARRGVVVVSGMAKGIDSAAHRGALSAGGVTVAVMGTGFRHIYPEGSEKLIKEICRRGAVLTEFTSGVFPGKNTFPRRNRIISGMSKGVIVVEAAKKSGALITVDFALEQGKDVFAVPGQIGNPMAAGTNLLIQNGAKIAISAADILEEIAPGRQAAENTPRAEVVEKDEGAVVPPGNVPEIRGKERDVLDAVTAKGKTHVDEIMAVSGVDEKSIHKALLYLELKGAIRALPGAMYERAMS